MGATPPNKMGTQTHTHMTTHRTTLATLASTQTLPPQEERQEGTMGGRATMTGTTVVRVMTTTGTWVMELEGREGETEEAEEE